MLISEKGLIACLKDAYKRTGYTILASGDCALIYASTWFVRIPFADLTNDVMSLVVKHAGLNVFQEGALLIVKGMDPQIVMPEAVGEDINSWIQSHENWAVVRVPVTVKGSQLYQIHQGPGNCYGTNPDDLRLVAHTTEQYKAVVMDDDRIAWSSSESEEQVIVRALRPIGESWASSNDQKVWSALETVNLGSNE